MSNPYARFLALLPPRPLLVGTVIAVDGEVATVELPEGGQLHARGAAAVNGRVFVRDGVIEGEAPNLTYISAEV
ncbi:hypothetical protein KIH07_03045 [Hydrogenophaga taeniospiralis]|nr:hypothetical protein [Hydrogenophaga taeniospiralis]